MLPALYATNEDVGVAQSSQGSEPMVLPTTTSSISGEVRSQCEVVSAPPGDTERVAGPNGAKPQGISKSAEQSSKKSGELGSLLAQAGLEDALVLASELVPAIRRDCQSDPLGIPEDVAASDL